MLLDGQPVWTYSYCMATLLDRTFMLIPSDDQPMIDAVKQFGAEYMTGSKLDVCDRYYQCCKALNLKGSDQFVRLTADCVAIPASIVLYMIHAGRVLQADYLAHTVATGAPDGWDVEILSMRLLEYVWKHSEAEREHVAGPYIWANVDKLRRLGYKIEAYHESLLTSWIPKMSIDTREDFDAIEKIVREIRRLETSG
jgi:spore coat polysaccharide biosynthesis protein SpsF (cytidylyltransferase family)